MFRSMPLALAVGRAHPTFRVAMDWPKKEARMISATRRSLLLGGGLAASTLLAGRWHEASAQSIVPRQLRIVRRTLDVNGRAASVYGLLNEADTPGLAFTTGDVFAVKLDNKSTEPTLIHWHGLTPPWRQDGVPDVTQPMLKPGETYDYSFPLTRPGTHWMHAHTLQEQELLVFRH